MRVFKGWLIASTFMLYPLAEKAVPSKDTDWELEGRYQRNLSPLTIFAPLTRAREAGRRDADRSARAAVADSFFVISGSGRRWSSGDRRDRR
jgi:hypothetical protein